MNINTICLITDHAFFFPCNSVVQFYGYNQAHWSEDIKKLLDFYNYNSLILNHFISGRINDQVEKLRLVMKLVERWEQKLI